MSKKMARIFPNWIKSSKPDSKSSTDSKQNKHKENTIEAQHHDKTVENHWKEKLVRGAREGEKLCTNAQQ